MFVHTHLFVSALKIKDEFSVHQQKFYKELRLMWFQGILLDSLKTEQNNCVKNALAWLMSHPHQTNCKQSLGNFLLSQQFYHLWRLTLKG